MNKKYVLVIFVLIMLCLSVRAARKYDVEQGNDKKHIDVARQISTLDGVDGAAVLSNHSRVLAGIVLFPDAEKDKIFAQAENVLKSTFPNAKEFRIFTDNKNAAAVVELSFCIESNIKKKLLLQRFDFLMKQNI